MTEKTEEKSTAAEFNLCVVLRAPACYVEDHFGTDKLNELAAASGLKPSDLDGETHWGTVEQCETFLAMVYDLVGRDDSAFVDVCGYKLAKTLGPVRYLLRARSPKVVYDRVVKDFPIVSTISSQEMVELSDQSCTIRYTTTKPESRLLCLSRQGTDMAVLTLWGLPKAQLKETACVARGDDFCEYHLSWYRPQQYLGLLIGLMFGVVTFLVGYSINPALALPLLGAAGTMTLLGHLVDLRTSNQSNLRLSEKMIADTRTLLHADAEARREILELNERQREWEKIVSLRSAASKTERRVLVEQLQALQSRLAAYVRGYGHDIGNPLTVLMAHSDILQKAGNSISQDKLKDILKFNDEAIERIRRLVQEMMALAKDCNSLKAVVPEEIDVHGLGRRLGSRIQALVHGRPIETAVHLQNPAPTVIKTDQLMFDRIIDNLLINAAKYTQEGRIDLYLSEWDGNFALEVRDTGRGIAQEDLPKIFLPEGSDAATREAGSFGLGLSVVTQLLAQLGGRLLVKSEPGMGSSFKCVLPAEYQPPLDDAGDPTLDAAVVSY